MITVEAGGRFGVFANHRYAQPGAYTAAVAIADAGGSQTSVNVPIAVTDSALTAAGAAIPAAVEGQAVSGAVATFADGDVSRPAGNYGASIAWGDGTTGAGSVVARAGGGFEVDGAHAYANPGTYPVAAAIADLSGTAHATASTAVTVVDAVLASTTVQFGATEGATFSATLASFADGDPTPRAPGYYAATVDWGDGSPVGAANILGSGGGAFTVTGSHAYLRAGSYPVTVTIADPGGQRGRPRSPRASSPTPGSAHRRLRSPRSPARRSTSRWPASPTPTRTVRPASTRRPSTGATARRPPTRRSPRTRPGGSWSTPGTPTRPPGRSRRRSRSPTGPGARRRARRRPRSPRRGRPASAAAPSAPAAGGDRVDAAADDVLTGPDAGGQAARPAAGGRGLPAAPARLEGLLAAATCPASAARCRGVARVITLPARGQRSVLRSGTALGSSLFLLGSGESRTVTIPVPLRLRKTLRQARAARLAGVAIAFGASGNNVAATGPTTVLSTAGLR